MIQTSLGEGFNLSVSEVVVGLTVLLLGYYLVLSVYNITLHPLASLPGPKLAGSSPLWLLYNTFSLRKCEALHGSLARYGPVVRIAPNKVLISTQADIKTVYGIGARFVKSDFYPPWGLDGASNIFSTVDPRDHSVRRSITAKTFARNSVVRFMPQMESHAESLVRNLWGRCCHEDSEATATATATTVEFLKVARYMALDMLGSSVLGEEFELLRTGREHPFVHDLDSAAMVIPTRATMPPWLWSLARRVPVARWQHHLGGEARLSEYARATVHRAFSAADEGKGDGDGDGDGSGSGRPTLVSSYAGYEDDGGRRLSTERIVGEIAAVYFAGTDTTSNSLTLAMYEIARRPDVQGRLRDEVRAAHARARALQVEVAGVDSDKAELLPLFVSHSVLEEDCPYLEAVISESLRLYAAIPSHLERVVPKGGAMLCSGHGLPGGTVVGVQSYSLHRDPELFPDPDRFDPDRWLDATRTAGMKRALSPWGFGSRVCMGMHLAYIEFRLVLAAVVGNFNVSLPEGFDHDQMRMKNLWFVFPVGGKLDVRLQILES